MSYDKETEIRDLIYKVKGLGLKIPKKDENNIDTLRQLLLFAKATQKTDSVEKRDSIKKLLNTKIDSIIGKNIDKKHYTSEMDDKLAKHMDSLAKVLYNYSDDPLDEINPTDGVDTLEGHKPQKSPKYNTEESEKKRQKDEARVRILKEKVRRDVSRRAVERIRRKREAAEWNAYYDKLLKGEEQNEEGKEANPE